MGEKTGGVADGVIDVFEVAVEGDDLVVVSMPIRTHAFGGALTAAERDVTSQVLAGLSTAAIARARGRSERTIANQLASIYRKLGVASRAELAALASPDETR